MTMTIKIISGPAVSGPVDTPSVVASPPRLAYLLVPLAQGLDGLR